MAWSQGWGQKWFTAPPTLLQKEGRFTPTSMGNGLSQPTGFPRTVQGLGVCILPLK